MGGSDNYFLEIVVKALVYAGRKIKVRILEPFIAKISDPGNPCFFMNEIGNEMGR